METIIDFPCLGLVPWVEKGLELPCASHPHVPVLPQKPQGTLLWISLASGSQDSGSISTCDARLESFSYWTS